jgi:DNA processing protein
VRDQEVLLWLCTTQGVGAVTIRKLHDIFGCWQNVWQASEHELVHAAGVRKAAAKELCKTRATFDPIAWQRQFAPHGIRFVSMLDAEYPSSLQELYDPPAGLFVVGRFPRCGQDALAVVGSRKPTVYGRGVTQKIVAECVRQGLTIVSGLARGVDTIAHETAVQAGGQTVAVLGSGLLNIYPKENLTLARMIADGHGTVISEWHPLMVGKPGNFPVRNRIISGLSQGTLVVEAGEKSGSLITADQALEQGRDVYAIPGPITSPQSAGTNRLIQQGAKLVLSAEDVLEDYGRSNIGLFAAPPVQEASLEREALFLLESIGHGEVHLDELAARTGWEMGLLHTWLLRLQVQGKIAALPGSKYACTVQSFS